MAEAVARMSKSKVTLEVCPCYQLLMKIPDNEVTFA